MNLLGLGEVATGIIRPIHEASVSCTCRQDVLSQMILSSFCSQCIPIPRRHLSVRYEFEHPIISAGIGFVTAGRYLRFSEGAKVVSTKIGPQATSKPWYHHKAGGRI